MQNSYYVETFGFKLKVGIKNEISITERERERVRELNYIESVFSNSIFRSSLVTHFFKFPRKHCNVNKIIARK